MDLEERIPLINNSADSEMGSSSQDGGLRGKNMMDEEDNRYFCCVPIAWITQRGKTPSNQKYEVFLLLLSAMIGSGILTQPFCFMKSGIALMFLTYASVSCLIWVSVWILIRTAEKLDVFNYIELMEKTLGVVGRWNILASKTM